MRADDAQVVFPYRKPNSARPRTMTLPPLEFMRRFLQHVLPAGFMKVRHFGFLSPSCSMPFEEVRARIEWAGGFAQDTAADSPPAEAPPAPRGWACPHCGGRLRWRSVLLPRPRGSRSLSHPSATAESLPAPRAVCASG